MANRFTLVDFIARLLFAVVLVFGTYNPTDFSYASWVMAEGTELGPVHAIVGIALLIGWIVFLRATFLSLGWLGVILFVALFSAVVWFFVDIGWLALDSTSAISWVVILLLALTLAVGMSWSHIRRQLSGVSPIDDVED